MSKWRDEAIAAARDEKYDAALDIMNAQSELCAFDLLFKGRMIQLSKGGEGRDINDAAEAFRDALTLARDFVPALLELGWTYLSVLNDPQMGKQQFDHAIDVLTRQTIEAFRGAAQCAEDIGGVEARAEVIRRASTLINENDLDDPTRTAS
jgi:hypothetical protein